MYFDQLIQDALAHEFTGWDFSHIAGRWREDNPTWNYRQCVETAASHASTLLDMGTGGGEFLASLTQRPTLTYATEGYEPNLPLARAMLTPLGVEVRSLANGDVLPFDDEMFDLVINQHESFDPREVYRVLKPHGRFITQQVGGRDNIELNEWLQEKVQLSYEAWDLATAVDGLIQAGFHLTIQREEFLQTTFSDIGAVVYYLKAIPWQIEGFNVESSRQRLRALHVHIQNKGHFVAHNHRFYIEATKQAVSQR